MDIIADVKKDAYGGGVHKQNVELFSKCPPSHLLRRDARRALDRFAQLTAVWLRLILGVVGVKGLSEPRARRLIPKPR
jgi:hypothetical protein